ncbi:MAG: hypothetical protein ACREPA_11595, partial [Candidatus Dormibacteraceae bacterium]
MAAELQSLARAGWAGDAGEVLTTAPDAEAERGERDREQGRLLVHDLLGDFSTLARLLGRELREGTRLNAFLLAAGLDQIAEDHLHRDPYDLQRAASVA